MWNELLPQVDRIRLNRFLAWQGRQVVEGTVHQIPVREDNPNLEPNPRVPPVYRYVVDMVLDGPLREDDIQAVLGPDAQWMGKAPNNRRQWRHWVALGEVELAIAPHEG
jgi:hypothetical protein